MGKRLKGFLAIMVVVALMIPIHVFGARYEELTVTKLKVKEIQELNATGGLTITSPTITGLLPGDTWYVDSSVSASGAGASWSNAVLTVDEAINLASANNGDVIYVAAGHAESFTAADGFDADKAGITIIGFGQGVDMPEFTFAHVDADVALGAANVILYNLRFLAGISEVVAGISIEAAADDCAIISCEFPEPTTSTFEFDKAILLATGADRLLVEKCKYYNADATGGTNFIDMDTGIVNGVEIIDNYIYGEFAEGAIHTDKVCLEMLIKGNTIVNMTSGQHGIEIAANATGLLVGNLVSTDAIGTSYDVGHLNEHGNYWDDYSTYDITAIPLNGFDEKCISKTLTTIVNGNNNLFTVAGGPIKIIEIVGIVDTVIEAKSCLINYNMDPTSPAGDTVFGTDGTALEINADAVGTLYTWDGVVATDLTATTNGVALGVPAPTLIVPAGSLELAAVVATSATGAITFYLRYKPMIPGAIVVAQ